MGFLFFASALPLGIAGSGAISALDIGGGRTTEGKGPSVGFRPPPPTGFADTASLVKGLNELLYLLSREARSPEMTGLLGFSTADCCFGCCI